MERKFLPQFTLSLASMLIQTAPPPTMTGQSMHPFAAYGPLLSSKQTFTMTYHSDPWLPSFTNEPGNIYLYASGQLRWYHPLEPNTRIIVQSSFSNTEQDAIVGDCWLDPPDLLTVDHAGIETIGSDYLIEGYGTRSDPGTFFSLDTLPTHGALLLDESPLAIGDHFTQADINSGRLRYAHDGSQSSEDSFAYHVEHTMRASVDSAGDEGNAASFSPSLSGDARLVIFASLAEDLIGDDSNEVSDIFVHDLVSGQTTRVSEAGDGTQADGASISPQISSAFGYPFVFESRAPNLETGECLLFDGEDGVRDIHLYFPLLLQVSVTPEKYGKCYQANQDSYDPSIAAYESSVAFVSNATNLLLGVDDEEDVIGRVDDNTFADVYHSDGSGGLSIVSVPNGQSGGEPTTLGNGGSYAPSVSANGNLVAFVSDADNLVAADGNGVSDVFVRSQNQTVRVSVHTDGTETNSRALNPAISGDGRFVAFDSFATNLVTPNSNGIRHIFVHDRDDPNQTTQVSLAADGTQGNGDSHSAAISFNGRFIAFFSDADNLVENDTNELADIFVHDRDTDGDGIFDEPGNVRTIRVSIAEDGSEGHGNPQGVPSISSDGYAVAFGSLAEDLVANDNNDRQDIFVHTTGVSSVFRLQIAPPMLHLRLPSVSK